MIVSADLSQIEPRVLAYLVGDMDFLGLVRGGIDLYEAHGRATGLYNEDEPMKDLGPRASPPMQSKSPRLGLRLRV